MITKQQFVDIDNEVQNAITDLFNHIRANCSEENYIFLLADGEYKADLVGAFNGYSPYVLDYVIDHREDRSRMEFLADFLSRHYTWDGFDQVDDDRYRINTEMMIYTHIWESISYLKRLFRITELAINNNYAWEVNVPEMGKHDFLRAEIRDRLRAKNLAISEIIAPKGFHTSLRNAFAHSQYFFPRNENRIDLLNYKGAGWELKDISFNDWSKRFTYSFFLNYRLHNFIQMRRIAVREELGKTSFNVNLPFDATTKKSIEIIYDEERDNFRGR